MTARVERKPVTVRHRCGWVKTYDTDGKAARGLRDHSCALAQVRVARQQRVEARKADTGTRRACAHVKARHVHGTRAAYVLDKCRCRPCRDANLVYRRNADRSILYGRWQPYVDAGPVRDHVLGLMANNLGRRTIADRAGVSDKTIGGLASGARAKVRAEVARKILAVTIDARAENALVPAYETWEYVHALIALGYTRKWIAAELGMGRVLQLGEFLVTQRRARDVQALAERTIVAAPPSGGASRSLAEARRMGWTTLTDRLADEAPDELAG